MSLLDLLAFGVNAGVDLFCLGALVYIAVRALALRRALVDRPYRSRAFWAAMAAIAVIAVITTGPIDAYYGNSTTVTAIAVEATVYGVFFLGLFGWIIVNNDVTLAADFLNRDALLWKRAGRTSSAVVWTATYVIINLPPWWFPASADSFMNFFANVISTFIFFGIAAYGAAVLYISYRRVSDLRIKTYTRWVVLSVVTLVLAILVSFFNVAFILGIPVVYCMYKSVQSLAIRTRKLESG